LKKDDVKKYSKIKDKSGDVMEKNDLSEQIADNQRKFEQNSNIETSKSHDLQDIAKHSTEYTSTQLPLNESLSHPGDTSNIDKCVSSVDNDNITTHTNPIVTNLTVDMRGKRVKTSSKEGSSTTTLFAQMVKIISMVDFKKIVSELNADKNLKGISNWEHFIIMLFVQISGASSIREALSGIACEGGNISHLGMQNIPSISGFSYANTHRSPELFEKVFNELYDRLSPLMPEVETKKFRFNNALFSIDSTIISLCMDLYDWAYYRTSKGAVKIHTVLEHNSYLPCYAVITDGKVGDITVAEQLEFPKNSIIIMDRGFVKLAYFQYLNDTGCYFVTRHKRNMQYKIVEAFEPPNPKGRPRKIPDPKILASRPRVVADEKIIFTSDLAEEKYDGELRLVTAWVKDTRSKTRKLCKMKFLTNNMDLSAATIAAIYQDRWAVESFFRMIKQNMRIKSFLGTTENAVRIQIWSALTAVLVLRYLKSTSTETWSLTGMLYLLRQNIHAFKNLSYFLNHAKDNLKIPKRYEKESFVPPGSLRQLF
jgi:hypothetical protein